MSTVVKSGELNCPSCRLREWRPTGRIIADLGLPVAERCGLWDDGMPGIRLCLDTYGSVRSSTVAGVTSLQISAVAVVIFLRLACIKLVAGSLLVG